MSYNKALDFPHNSKTCQFHTWFSTCSALEFSCILFIFTFFQNYFLIKPLKITLKKLLDVNVITLKSDSNVFEFVIVFQLFPCYKEVWNLSCLAVKNFGSDNTTLCTSGHAALLKIHVLGAIFMLKHRDLHHASLCFPLCSPLLEMLAEKLDDKEARF